MLRGVLFDKDDVINRSEDRWYSVMTRVFDWMTDDGDLNQETVSQLQTLSGYTADGFDEDSVIIHLPVTRIVSRWALEVADSGYDRRTYSNYFGRLFELALIQEGDDITLEEDPSEDE